MKIIFLKQLAAKGLFFSVMQMHHYFGQMVSEGTLNICTSLSNSVTPAHIRSNEQLDIRQKLPVKYHWQTFFMKFKLNISIFCYSIPILIFTLHAHATRG